MRRWRELILVVLLFGALAGVTVLTYPLLPRDERQPAFPTTHSAAPEGCKALYLWLTDLGYDVRRVEGDFYLADDIDMLFVVAPWQEFYASQAQGLIDWVERGHNLVLTPNWVADRKLLNLLRVDIGPRPATGEEVTPMSPVLLSPPVRRVAHGARRSLRPWRLDTVPLLGPADTPIMLAFTHGRGRVYILASEFPFTNAGIDQADNARLVLNLVGAPESGVIAFDEYHHGYRREGQASLEEGLFTQPWGWAALYGVGVVMLFLALRGRRLGQPLPPERHQRRTVAEYVSSMAGLFRRAGQRDAVRRHYRREFRRQLARPYGIDSELDADEFVRQLARYRPVDQDRLLNLLYRLNHPTSEAGLLRLVQEMEEFVMRKT